MQIDIARYSKLISPKNTGHNEEKEEKLLERCPPGHEGTKLVDKPATIIDASGTIIAWYLLDALTETTQVCNVLKKSVKADGNWQYNQEWFKQGSENVGSTPGCINLSPAWFQQGHEVGCDEMGPSSENILKAIARLAAIASAALRSCILSSTLQGYEPYHLLIPECFNILTTMGNYSNARMSMPSLQLEFRYDSGCMIAFSGRIVRHGFME
ncbi:hypothetical protein BDR07DRAFT_1306163 [Suillus spraguei]|nr:hypothetical protein BDR07DRAFT_1306163 [Suillus spraguei]